MKLLIVEDSVTSANYIAQGFRESGFVVDIARTGSEGLGLAMTEQYDMIILDVMLPEIDGLKILKSLRAVGNSIPVMLLTARSSVDDRVTGLELGADDYLTKPFFFAELLARVRTLLRRGVQQHNFEPTMIADLTVDLLKRRVTRAGRQINLTNKEFSLLELLLRHRGEVLTRSIIASQVWDMNFDSDTNVIDVAVRRLRAKIDDAFEPKLVQTVRGMGYMIDLPDSDANV